MNAPEQIMTPAEVIAEMDRCVRLGREYRRAGEACAEMDPDVVRRWRIAFANAVPSALSGTNAPLDLEGLGDALSALSAKLLSSGFLNDDANHAVYEKVVAQFRALPSALSGDAGEGRVQKYLSDETAARARLTTFPDAVRQRLHDWQEGQSEWFSDTVLEIVAEFIAFENAAHQGTGK